MYYICDLKSIVLFPNYFKKIGWVLIVAALGIWLCSEILDLDLSFLTLKVPAIYSADYTLTSDPKGGWFVYTTQDMAYTLFSVFFIVGGLLVMFAREQVEDEFIHSVRHSALIWAVSINYLLLLLAFLGLYGPVFIDVVIYNVYSILIIYILRFNYLLRISKKRALVYEE